VIVKLRNENLALNYKFKDADEKNKQLSQQTEKLSEDILLIQKEFNFFKINYELVFQFNFHPKIHFLENA
jgi:hypothetical protein